MEHWILHDANEYEAVPWPFRRTWDEFIAAPEALTETREDFGRAAPCDSLSETPHVPPNLPRLAPRGRYRAAIYHDAEFLYGFIDAQNGPVIVSDEALANIPHLRGLNPLYPVLVLLSRDQRFIFSFGLDGRGDPAGRVAPLVYGARKRDPEPRELKWDLRIVRRADGELTCIRVARASIADTFDGGVTRLSLTRMHFGSIEAVAWGSHTTWGVRPDEMRTVRLVERRETPPWPRVRRVDMLYEPAAEKARFRVTWDGPYEPSELGSVKYLDPNQQAAMDKCVLSWNGREHVLDLRAHVESPEIPVPDGFNRLQIRSTGGPQLQIELEKWSGNRIIEIDLPEVPAWSHERVLARLRDEVEAGLKRVQERASQGEARKYTGWATYEAASLGRAHHYLTPDPRLLEALRIEADFVLSLQRPDGSFAGLHTARYGKPTVPWAGGAYDSGPAGELWVLAARMLGDAKYLDASRRLVHAYRDYRVEFNYNFAAFALYHLVTHYAFTRDDLALEHALYYAKHCVAIDILPLGFQAGHNYYSCYGSITLRGIALLAGLLPDGDPYKAVLREQAIRMANQAITRQQPDGSFDGRDRYFIGRRWWMWGLFPVAFQLDAENVARLDKVIQRMLAVPHAPGNISSGHVLQSDAIRYFAHREKLLRGERIDLAWLL
jgi:hypothetical protein